mgnify:CR=1 FL=1
MFEVACVPLSVWTWDFCWARNTVTDQAAFACSSTVPEVTEIRMPALSPTMAAGNIVSLRKAVGDKVSEGDMLAEIETDKATLEFESTDEGYLAKLFVEEGQQEVPVGQVWSHFFFLPPPSPSLRPPCHAVKFNHLEDTCVYLFGR